MHFQLLFQLDQNTNKYYTSNIYIYFCCSEIITKKRATTTRLTCTLDVMRILTTCRGSGKNNKNNKNKNFIDPQTKIHFK